MARARKGRVVCSLPCQRRLSSMTMSATNRKYASARMKRKNPMKDPKARAKVSASLRVAGRRPRVRGGNGHRTVPQVLLAKALGWPTEVSIPIKMPGWGFPKAYKVDIGNEVLKIAVEVDGNSHRTLKGREKDRKKDFALGMLGWTVLRFWNHQVTDDLQGCVRTVLSTISK